jgi:hypothetical protein
VDLYRAAADPSKPDNSGRKDLDFGVIVHLEAGSSGAHTLRIEGVPPIGQSRRDMVYVDGLSIAGEPLPPTPGSPSEESTVSMGQLATAVQQVFDLAATAATTQVTLVLETAPGATVSVVDPTSRLIVATATVDDGVAVIRLTPNGPANYAVVVSASPKTAWTAWSVMGKYR